MLSASRLGSLSQRPLRATSSGCRPAMSRRSVQPVQAKFNLAPIVDSIAQENMKPKDQVPKPDIGDTVKMGLRVIEAKGKTRTQKLEGVIIAEAGSGINKTITFRRMFQGVGIEMIIPVHSPVLESIELVRSGRVRRAKLYYLRERIGKAAKLKEVVQGAKSTKPTARKEKKAAAAAQQE
mmetsp:Transcript_13379/g.36278  ORF Transcript_13379/g.36278 Transcript_13379/m.36278 type:complete len:180 (-) Transcript_13379:61-600(-)|eukprot:CAMPEP_0202377086 /NCGR_PEP_ID=MMETSP1127-20130417/8479_1 /ASSEMBLY_ACC=CAM_ASM_000462 /TAXON_ID=3047 /ORGANISM="Dunaliella tertiolecta, Strain CCMP1320" /LENGTH=179 /DNA_ID=CAMNT_0048975039 /DNA_START=33 /DNA_END=572 /DNA_ORIENTATION=-